MTLEILVSSALMGYTMDEQSRILKSIEEGSDLPTARLKKGAEKVIEVFNDWEPVVEGYAGFPVEREAIQKKKDQHKDDRNVGRVVSQGGSQYVITGKKADGRYIVVGKKGDKTAKDAGDIGVTKNESVVGIDIEDLHNMMLEGMKQARKNVGADSCWDGYSAKGTKKKGGKEVPNCVKEEELDELYKGKHGQSEKEYQDSRSDGGKMISGDSKHSGAAYSHRSFKGVGKPAKPGERQKNQGKMDRGTRADIAYRKANLKAKNEEFDALVNEIILDEAFDDYTFEELHDICVEALNELDIDDLHETFAILDDIELLTEVTSPAKVNALRLKDKASAASGEGQSAGRDAGAEARKRLGDKKPEAKPEVGARREKMKAALKSAGSVVKKGLKTAGAAASKGAGYAAGAAGRAAKGAASNFKKGYERGSQGSSGSSSTSSVSSGSTSNNSGGSTSSSSSEPRTRLRDKIKSGIKKVVGGVARSVSRGARGVARRMGEETTYSWRDSMGLDQ
jgi:hypothetical protein